MSTEPSYRAVRRFRAEVPQGFRQYPVISNRDTWIGRRILSQAQTVLEIGCGDTPFDRVLREDGYNGSFKTMDVDPDLSCDYYSLDDIHEDFDAVIMREVIEHLPRPLFFSYLDKIRSLLNPGGLLVLTTPNPWAPSWVFSDYTHQSPWPPADLYGVLRWYGFESVEIHRIIWPSRFPWLKRWYWALHSRLYDIDFAGSYVALAVKPPTTDGAIR